MLHYDPEVGWASRRSVWSHGHFSYRARQIQTRSHTLFAPSDLVTCTPGSRPLRLEALALGGTTGVAVPSPVHPPSPVWVRLTAAACSDDLAYPQAEQKEGVGKDKGIRDSAVSLRATWWMLGVHRLLPLAAIHQIVSVMAMLRV